MLRWWPYAEDRPQSLTATDLQQREEEVTAYYRRRATRHLLPCPYKQPK
jgi:hypothetical protein